MNLRKVSIIIPTLNEEKLIRNVLSQFDDGVKKKII
jgi:glycosyltransferase involved in cell wall biosynthesis